MQDDKFEWDDKKAASNWRDHTVTFRDSSLGMRRLFAVEWLDDSQDETEERFSLLGMVNDRLIFVAYTMRNGRIRIISARKAEPFERRKYRDENRDL